MKIVVLVKQVPDTYEERQLDADSGRIVREGADLVLDEINERALEVALSHKDKNKETEVVLLTMGPAEAADALRKGLSMGADSAVHVVDDELAGSDLQWTAEVLAAALTRTGFDLVIAGNESTDGRGGMIPAMIAEHLRVPHLTSLNTAVLSATTIRGERGTESGAMVVEAVLPAVVSVTERSPEARFPGFKGIMTAKRKPVVTLSLGDLGTDPASSGSGRSAVRSALKRPARTAGKKVIDEGNAAAELVEFLVAERVI
jgi:electron transfer flavoprotein beta subunit